MDEITRELIITTHENDVQIALLEDKKLVELHRETTSDEFAVGDIYIGKVHRLNAGLNAAFVTIGADKDAFLHYLDLGPHIATWNKFLPLVMQNKRRNIDNFPLEPIVDKNGKIGEVLSQGQEVLVQIAKESISTKGPRVTTDISLAGRYVVLMPFAHHVSISQKIRTRSERKRLQNLVEGIRPRNFGVIVRTVAKDKSLEDISADMQVLLSRWSQLMTKLSIATVPERLVEELDKSSVILRDLLNSSFNAICVDSPQLYQELKSYVHSYAGGHSDIVKLHKDPQPIFEYYNVAKQIKGAFGKVLTLRNGIYLIIEHTEAMHVIDVNSGNRIKSDDHEENALSVNMDAAVEIARQLRLRDMGGLVVIDFIDMDKMENRRKLHQYMMELMKGDRAKHTVLPLSKFCLMEITRQRVRQATTIDISEQCPVCQGSGKIKPSILIEEEIENMLDFLFMKQMESKLTLAMHPYLYAYFTKGLISKQVKWFFKYRKWVRLKAQQGYHFLEYRFFNQNNDPIVLWER